jgi:hypothetical protein
MAAEDRGDQGGGKKVKVKVKMESEVGVEEGNDRKSRPPGFKSFRNRKQASKETENKKKGIKKKKTSLCGVWCVCVLFFFRSLFLPTHPGQRNAHTISD